MSLDNKIKLVIKSHIDKLKSHAGKKFTEKDSSYPKRQQEKDLQQIQEKLRGVGICPFTDRGEG